MAARSYLVTGASTGIGRACVEMLVAQGAHVWATVRSERDEAKLNEAFGDKVSVLRFDITDYAAVAEAGARVRAAGPLNGVVNNAGVAMPAPLEHLPIESFRHNLEVNVTGQLAVTQAVLPALRKAREQGQTANIVMIGSIAGRIAGPLLGAYHTSKFALTGLSDSLRAELAPQGIQVVLIEPGPIVTEIWQRSTDIGNELLERIPEEGKVRYAKQIAAVRANTEAAPKRGLPVAKAASLIVKALTAKRPRPRYLLGFPAHAASLVAKLPFRLRYRLTAGK